MDGGNKDSNIEGLKGNQGSNQDQRTSSIGKVNTQMTQEATSASNDTYDLVNVQRKQEANNISIQSTDKDIIQVVQEFINNSNNLTDKDTTKMTQEITSALNDSPDQIDAQEKEKATSISSQSPEKGVVEMLKGFLNNFHSILDNSNVQLPLNNSQVVQDPNLVITQERREATSISSQSPEPKTTQIPQTSIKFVPCISHNSNDRLTQTTSEETQDPDLIIAQAALKAIQLSSQAPPPTKNGDSDAIPRRQHLKNPGDLYTPQWVRYDGKRKEGHCDLCPPGLWLGLKKSAFWYHKQFYHGISSISGKFFVGPTQLRKQNEDIEGLCHQCKKWIQMSTGRKRNFTWFRHASKCHVYRRAVTIFRGKD